MPDSKSPILFVQTAFLGDLILGVPTFKQIRRLAPGHPLWVVAKKGLGQFLLDLGLIDRLFEVEKGNFSSYKTVRRELAKTHFHWILAPHESMTTARLIAPLKAEEKIGFRKFWNRPFFSNRVRKSKDLPEALRQLELLSALKSESAAQEISRITENIRFAKSQNWLEPKESLPAPPNWASGHAEKWPSLFKILNSTRSVSRDLAQNSERPGNPIPIGDLGVSQDTPVDSKTRFSWDKSLASHQPVAIFPGSVWETKRWTEMGFRELVEKFQQMGRTVYLFGGPEEVELCQRIAAGLSSEKEPGAPRVTVLAGQLSLTETLFQLAGCQMVISNDSAGTHLGGLAGVPVLTIFGPTVIAQGFRPWSQVSAAVWQEGVTCRPCGPHGHHQCPISTHICMKSLTAETVFQAARKLLPPAP